MRFRVDTIKIGPNRYVAEVYCGQQLIGKPAVLVHTTESSNSIAGCLTAASRQISEFIVSSGKDYDHGSRVADTLARQQKRLTDST